MPWYELLKALHIISIISWMAGILYLYRLFVYHAEETEAVVKSRFMIMEQKLLRVILLPAAVASLIFGVWMLVMNPALLHQEWMHAKLGLVGLLLFLTHYAGRLRKSLAAGTCRWTGKQLRLLNEAPTILMILIVLLVVLRPF